MEITVSKTKCFCGIFGISNHKNPAMMTYYGLHALQHRGQEASGMVTHDIENGKDVFRILKGEGLVSEVFDDFDDWQPQLLGDASIGHNRYSTTGSSNSRKNIQPFLVNYHSGNLAVAHNGNLTNDRKLRKWLEKEGSIFQTTSDTEVILHLIAKSQQTNQVDQVVEALNYLEGAFSLVILTDKYLIAARDKFGFRPLCIGKLGNSYVVASETCAFDIISAQYLRDVEPGEVVIIPLGSSDTEPFSKALSGKNGERKQCIFEYIYFSRPDSMIFGHNVDKIRRRLGKILAKRYPVIPKNPEEKVIVMSVPDSSNTAALGYARELEKMGVAARFEIGLLRSHYIGRTFIEPGQENREMRVKIKFNPVKGVLKDKIVVVVDDSIVRGTTSKQLISLIREAGPKEIHFRISSPPIMHSCYYGMDFPSKEELIAFKMAGDVDSIRDYIGVDSLSYLTINDLYEAVKEDRPEDYCTACFSGEYPTDVDFTFTKEHYEV
jgi:amidophosphoribosyltransferase